MQSIKTIRYSTHFERAMRKLSPNLYHDFAQREKIFRKDCVDPRLKTHKLKGKYSEYWSFSVTYQHRIIFQFLTDDMVYFIDVGDHSIYQ